MQVYRVIVDGTERCEYRQTRGDAHELAKASSPRPEVRIEMVEMPTDKEAVINMLNCAGATMGTVLRTWALTDRGGIKEVPNGE